MKLKVTQSLSDAWIDAVRMKKIVNEFITLEGDTIEFGLKLIDGNLEYYAKNVVTSAEIQATVEEKAIGDSDFIIQYNGYRALRPGGKSPKLGRQLDVSAEVADCRFYCQDPKKSLSLLRRDPLIQVTLPNWRWNAYYNATPFEKEGHFLWLPVIVNGTTTFVPHLPQKLTLAFLEDTLSLFRNSMKMVVFFNSLHAGASVNHIHLQAVFHKQELAIERTSIISKGKFAILDAYPANGLVFEGDSMSEEIFSYVDRLQTKGIPFNLILLGKRIYLLPRDINHEIVAEFPGGVLGSMELAGKIITVDRNAYDNVNYGTLQTAFSKVTLSKDEIVEILNE